MGVYVNKYIPGRKVGSLNELEKIIERNGWVYLNHKPLHPSWVDSMTYRGLRRYIHCGQIRVAKINPEWLKKHPVRVFELNDYDWWAGHTLSEVKRAYLKITGIDSKEAFDSPRELTEEEMEKHILHKQNGQTVTFKEGLQEMIKDGTSLPTFFASTEY